MSQSGILGEFNWHELMTSDVEAAKRFYASVVGWTTQPFGGNSNYEMFVGVKGPQAGVMVLPDDAKNMGAPPQWLSYVGTPHLIETVERAAALGGRVVKAPWDIPDVGRVAILSDPQGATFALYQPAAAPANQDHTPGLGSFSWHELTTSDADAAFAFYHGLFGWEKTGAMDMGPEYGMYQMFGFGSRSLGGMMKQPKEKPGPPSWLPYAMVSDARVAGPATKSHGGQELHTTEVPGGDWIMIGLDPQGAAFAVHSLKPATTETPAATPPRRTKTARKAATVAATTATEPAAKPAPAKSTAARPAAAKVSTRKTAAKSAPAKPAVTRPAAKTSRKPRAGRKPVPKRPVKRATTPRRASRPAVAKRSAKKVSTKSARKATAARRIAKKSVRRAVPSRGRSTRRHRSSRRK